MSFRRVGSGLRMKMQKGSYLMSAIFQILVNGLGFGSMVTNS